MKKSLYALNPHFQNAGLLLLGWVFVILLVNPIGEFPLNDDWAFGLNVKNWVEGGRLVFNDWMTMTLLVHFLWGSLFCKIFGFSFTVLRISSLCLAYMGILVTYFTVYEVSRHTRIALFAALVIGFNPLYFSLSFSYMTDVPFLAFFCGSILFYTKHLSLEKSSDFIWGTVFAVLAVLIRQFALLLPVAFGVACFFKKRTLVSVLKGSIAFGLTFGAMLACLQWLESIGDNPLLGKPGSLVDLLKSGGVWKNILFRTDYLLFYIGLFLLPIIVLYRKRWLPFTWRNGLTLVVSMLIVFFFLPHILPNVIIGNIWGYHGLGPVVLKDAFWGINLQSLINESGIFLLKLVGVMGAVLLLFTTFSDLFKVEKGLLPIKVFAISGLLIYSSFLIVNLHFFDRYFLPLFPLWLLLILEKEPVIKSRFTWGLAIGLWLIMATFSVAGTHDHLSWNRARWKALDHLTTEQNIDPTHIDGGFEFNGWHQTHERRPLSLRGISWWFVDDDQYAITMGPIDCYNPINYYPYQRWLPPRRDSIFLNQRTTFSRVDTLYCDVETLSPDSSKLLGQIPDIQFDNAKMRDTTHAHSGRYAVRTDPQNAFAFPITLKGVHPCERYRLRVWRYAAHDIGVLVVSAPDAKDFYHNGPIGKLQKDENDWVQLELGLTLPADFKGDQLKLYIWNPNKEAAWFDDFEVIRRYW